MAAMKMSTAVSLSLLLWLSIDLHTIPVSEAARILAVETIAGKSHWSFMSSVIRSLTDAGHNVTVFTPFPDGNRENYTEVDTSRDFPIKLNLDVMQAVQMFGEPFSLINNVGAIARFYCDAINGNRELADVLASGARDRYDLLLIEPLGVDCVSHMADALGIPMIYTIPSPMITFIERQFTGHLSNPSSVPHMFANHAVPGTFVQRFTNAAMLTHSLAKTKYDQLVMRFTDARPYDLAPTVSPSIIFQNSHYATESSRPLTPNVVYVGGIHLKPAKTIPKDILDFIEDSPHGVILFTLGSTMKVSSLPEHIEKALKEALADVPQKVLWKYEGEMKDKPKNVMTKTWFPQREILLHPKVKLFISHGGMSGVYEAVDAGVPVLGIPVFYDQPRNIEHLVLAGMAISMDLLSTSKEKLSNAISKLINDESYAKNAKIASIRFKDRPMTPQQSVVYWTEYVIRHKGAPHLKSHALNLTWYQYLLLDVMFVALTFVFLVTFLVYKVLKYIRKPYTVYCSTFGNKRKTPMAAMQMSTAVSLTFLLWLSIDLRTIPVSEAARILAIETIAGKSHWNFMSSVLRSLTDAGHTVTVFTPFPDGHRTNYTEVDMSRNFPMKLEMDAMQTIKDFGEPFALVKLLSRLSQMYCDVIHGNQKLVELLASGTRDRFDLLLVEPLCFDCVSYIADTLGLPVIYLIPSPMIFTERLFTGHLSNPSSVSNILANHAVPATFVQRFTNTALLTYSMVRIKYDELVTWFTDTKSYGLVPTVNPSIIFQNSHYVTESPRPLTPNVIYVGGIHLKPAKPIPKDILDFIEDSMHGVIFFTFGSTVKVSSLPEHIEKAFKEALADVPQRVLWKYEGEMKDKPKNVMTKKWFPQREILLHSKVKLFISHGGMSGVYEAVDAGVPVLGFPMFYDQPRNIEHLVLAGMAISMDLLSTSKEKLSNAISKLINDESYTKNAKIASIQFKDRPMTPQQSVVYWTEYVIRHKGAPHLKSHALNLTWYQYLLLDVMFVALTFVFLVTFLVYKVLKYIRKLVFKNDKAKTE
ncbi:hypothetical protein AGLY_007455 [Aphis glycines]|uniref:UDP-glycosyltransferases domain-containing protein n=1 Tax=Aphis glycines TaxID=307491 RepID=A0A6G0TMX7_APHGL|nr:hypothetical protein AGLY_007455 [Aphis glycines]